LSQPLDTLLGIAIRGKEAIETLEDMDQKIYIGLCLTLEAKIGSFSRGIGNNLADIDMPFILEKT